MTALSTRYLFAIVIVVFELSMVSAEQYCRCYESVSEVPTEKLDEEFRKKPDHSSLEKIQKFIHGNLFMMHQFYGDYQPEELSYSGSTPPSAFDGEQCQDDNHSKQNTISITTDHGTNGKDGWSREWSRTSHEQTEYRHKMTYESSKRGHRISTISSTNKETNSPSVHQDWSIFNDRFIENLEKQKQEHLLSENMHQEQTKNQQNMPQRNIFGNRTHTEKQTVQQSGGGWMFIDEQQKERRDQSMFSASPPKRQTRRMKRSVLDGSKRDLPPKNYSTCCGEVHQRYSPHQLYNMKKELRVVVNTPPFIQVVDIIHCSKTTPNINCRPPCHCHQEYRTHRLMVIDPNSSCRGVFMDWFIIPSHCSCICPVN